MEAYGLWLHLRNEARLTKMRFTSRSTLRDRNCWKTWYQLEDVHIGDGIHCCDELNAVWD